MKKNLRLLLLGGSILVLVVNVEVLELVGVLALRDHAKPIAQLLLLQVLLREVLDVLLGEGDGRAHGELRLLPGDLDRVAKLASLAVHLDAIVKVLLLNC